MSVQKGSSEGEDIPSDFFDDFSKDEFMAGLSVIDTWDEDDKSRQKSRINVETLDSVRDLRELIYREKKEGKSSSDRRSSRGSHLVDDFIKPGSRRDPTKTNEAIKKDKELKVKEYLAKHLESADDLRPPGTELDDFFGDTKVHENIKLTKRDSPLSSEDPISSRKFRHETSSKYISEPRRHSPRYTYKSGRFHESPGTFQQLPSKYDFPARYRFSPGRYRRSPERYRGSPGRHRGSPGRHRGSPGRYRGSPGRYRGSPGRYHRSSGKYHGSPGRYHASPGRHRDSVEHLRDFSEKNHLPPRIRQELQRRHYISPEEKKEEHNRHQDPYRHRNSADSHRNAHRSPRRENELSPQRHEAYRRKRPKESPMREHTSRSPSRKQYRRSRSQSLSNRVCDDFLYPNATPNFTVNNPQTEMNIQPQYPGAMLLEYQMGPAGPLNTSGGPLVPQGYTYDPTSAYGSYNAPIEFSSQSLPVLITTPQPVPAPIMHPIIPPISNLPSVLPSPSQLISSALSEKTTAKTGSTNMPSDALAKLVADGKLSHEDYLKLAPNKGVTLPMDTHARVGVLNRCHNVMSKLNDLMPPNRLLIGKINEEPIPIAPKFCSPLKRQPNIVFNFTKPSASAVALQNKHIIDTIISTLELNKLFGRPKRNVQKNMRDVAVQTSTPHCDVCVIRKATTNSEVGTSIDPEYFKSTIHTQVVEEDLMNSKSVFNPSGSIADGAPISIAHMTPAQLVSQLAARAKSLKQLDSTSSSQFHNRNPYDGRGDSHYRHNYNNNYRY